MKWKIKKERKTYTQKRNMDKKFIFMFIWSMSRKIYTET